MHLHIMLHTCWTPLKADYEDKAALSVGVALTHTTQFSEWRLAISIRVKARIVLGPW